MTVELDATLAVTNIKYQWYKNGQAFSKTPRITVAEQGIYKVEAQIANGYIIQDEINVSVREYEIAADFAVATKTLDKTTTRLVNISYPYPDKIEWILPKNNVTVISAINEYADLVFNKNGRYTIGLHVWKGDCETTVYKEIDINNINEINIINPESEPKNIASLNSFIAYPNPNRGQFTVHVELGIKTDIRLRLLSLTGTLLDERVLKGSHSYDTSYNFNGIDGLYIIQLTTGNINTSLKLIIGGN
jgi:hypothetical protein